MSKPTTLLESICAHALSLGAQAIEVEHKDRREWIFATNGGIGTGIANYRSSSAEAKELRTNLYAAAKKPVRTVIAGQVYILKVAVFDSFGEDAFSVNIDPAPKLDPSIPPSFTAKQGQYLAFIYNYTKIHRLPPAESDLEHYFQVSPPAIHDMIKLLERNGFIERTPGVPGRFASLYSRTTCRDWNKAYQVVAGSPSDRTADSWRRDSSESPGIASESTGIRTRASGRIRRRLATHCCASSIWSVLNHGSTRRLLEV